MAIAWAKLRWPAQEHPDVPVVTNMEDIWKVSKLQREREAKKDAAAKEQARKEVVEAATKEKQDKETRAGTTHLADTSYK